MKREAQSIIARGMKQDISPSKADNQFIFEARNIRITARDGDTLLSITNEKGNKEIRKVQGEVKGYCVLGDLLTVFTHDDSQETKKDYIYRIQYNSKTSSIATLYNGNLNLSGDIQTLGIYENENIRKVYWVDSINQPRVINITKDYLLNTSVAAVSNKYNDTSFDFVPQLRLYEEVAVETIQGGNGKFAPGIIQYAFTYYNRYGQESNIFYTTDLNYITWPNRGGSPDDKINVGFSITIKQLDTRFEYIRVYSIHRTSIDATPEVKQIADLPIDKSTITYIDTGNVGESVDPTLLLYIGGEDIVAKTIAHKDNTLFLGNIKLSRPSIPEEIKNKLIPVLTQEGDTIRESSGEGIIIQEELITKQEQSTSYRGYYYYNTQFGFGNTSTFKCGEHYRLGVQFQYKTGKWSEPIVVSYAYTVNNRANYSNFQYQLPSIKIQVKKSVVDELTKIGFLKVRALVVNPSIQDRKVILQGLLCPTVYNEDSRTNNTPYSQSSWFLRPSLPFDKSTSGQTNIAQFVHGKHLSESIVGQKDGLEMEEIENGKDENISFKVDQNIVTLHSPDIEFDDSIQTLDSQSFKMRIVGLVNFDANIGDIDIQTSSPTINAKSAGFVHETFGTTISSQSARSLMYGLYYRDWLVDDKKEDYFRPYDKQYKDIGFMVYPWQCSGSLNNDIPRPNGVGTQSAVLKRKVISNLKTSYSNLWFDDFTESQKQLLKYDISPINIFNSNQVSLTKVEGNSYYGNVDTLLYPKDTYSKIVSATYPYNIFDFKNAIGIEKLGDVSYGNQVIIEGWRDSHIGDFFEQLESKKASIRMKYKSTPHIVFQLKNNYILPSINNLNKPDTSSSYIQNNISANIYNPYLFLAELYRDTVDNAFGGTDQQALQSNLWIPSGESVSLSKEIAEGNYNADSSCVALHGDTWYQRYDCLKTYPFTQEDENSIVEIGSFMVETRVNIDGRYDRNRGLTSNINVSPTNFNLLNKVYSQKNNFFNYRILDEDFYKLDLFPNTITWSKEKALSESIDTWTNINVTNTIDLDGDKGEINSIVVFNNELYCFQDSGISNILFNNRVQIPTSDNVPIEISNGYKVQGKRYISNSTGCQNQKAVISTPNGIYFSDLYNSALYILSSQGLNDLSTTKGFVNWVKDYNPNRVYYDINNGDTYFMGNGQEDFKNCLCFSEKLGEFSSFMDYGTTQGMFNIQDNFYAFGPLVNTSSDLYQQFEGDYNNIFGITYPYSVTYISNQQPQKDKIFNTIEFRADILDENNNVLNPPICPFDNLKVWNEYQEGEYSLISQLGKVSTLRQKFRIWRANVPRDKSNGRDRIRNPWIYAKLEMNNPKTYKAVLHDVLVSYFV